MDITATSTSRKTSLHDACGKMVLKAQNAKEAEWLAKLYRAFVLGKRMPTHPRKAKPDPS